MTILYLETRPAAQWAIADEALEASLRLANHPLLDQHAATAGRLLLDTGRPTAIWADRIAAVAIIATRRADAAPTMQRRSDYLAVYDAASALLRIADHVHGVQPRAEARRLLAETVGAAQAVGDAKLESGALN